MNNREKKTKTVRIRLTQSEKHSKKEKTGRLPNLR